VAAMQGLTDSDGNFANCRSWKAAQRGNRFIINR